MDVDFSFFKFDPYAWLTGKVQLLNDSEKVTFLELVCRIFLNSGKIRNDAVLARLLHLEKVTFDQYVATFLELGIVEETDGFLSVKFVTKAFDDFKAYHENRALCGAQKNKRKKVTSTIRNKKEEIRDKKEDINSEKEIKEKKEDTATEYDVRAVIKMAADACSPHIPSIECAHEFLIQFHNRHPEFHGGIPQGAVMRELPNFVLKWENDSAERRATG